MIFSEQLTFLFLFILIHSGVNGSAIIKRDDESVTANNNTSDLSLEKSLFGEGEERTLEREILQELNRLNFRKQREIFNDLEKQHEKFNASIKSLVFSETQNLSPLSLEELKTIKKTIKASNSSLPTIRNKRTLGFLLGALIRAMGYTLTPSNADAEWLPRQQPPPTQPCSTPPPPCPPSPPSTAPPCSMPPSTPPCGGRNNALTQLQVVPPNQIDTNALSYPYILSDPIPVFKFAPLPPKVPVPYPPLLKSLARLMTTKHPLCSTTPAPTRMPPCGMPPPSPPPCGATPAPSPSPCGMTPAYAPRPCNPAPSPPCGTTPAPPAPPQQPPCAPPAPPQQPPCAPPAPPQQPPCAPPAPPQQPPCAPPAPPQQPPCAPPAPSQQPPCAPPAPSQQPPCAAPAPPQQRPCAAPAPPQQPPCAPPAPSQQPPCAPPAPSQQPPCVPPAPPCVPPAPPCNSPPLSPSKAPKKASIFLEYDDPVRIQIFSNEKKYLPVSGNIFSGHDDGNDEDLHGYFFPVNENNEKKHDNFEEKEEVEEEHIEEEEDEEAPGQLKHYEEEDERTLVNNEEDDERASENNEEEDESETNLSIVKKPVDKDMQKTHKQRMVSTKKHANIKDKSKRNDEDSKKENSEKSQKMKKPKRKKWIRIVKKQRRKTKTDSNPHDNFQIYTSDSFPEASRPSPKYFGKRESHSSFDSYEKDVSDVSDASDVSDVSDYSDSSSRSTEDVAQVDLKKITVRSKDLNSPEHLGEARNYDFNFNPYAPEPEELRRKKLEKAVERYVEDYVQKQLGDELIKNTGIPKTTVFEFTPKNGPKIQTITTTVAKSSHSGNPANFTRQTRPETHSHYKPPTGNSHVLKKNIYEENSKKRGNFSYESFSTRT